MTNLTCPCGGQLLISHKQRMVYGIGCPVCKVTVPMDALSKHDVATTCKALEYRIQKGQTDDDNT